jgi:hypothetical protein
VIFLSWHDFAGQHGLVDKAVPIGDHTIHGHAIAGLHADQITWQDGVDRHLFVPAMGDAPDGGRSELHQRTQGSPSAGSGLGFQHLPQQDQHRDHGCCFEVEGMLLVADSPDHRP